MHTERCFSSRTQCLCESATCTFCCKRSPGLISPTSARDRSVSAASWVRPSATSRFALIPPLRFACGSPVHEATGGHGCRDLTRPCPLLLFLLLDLLLAERRSETFLRLRLLFPLFPIHLRFFSFFPIHPASFQSLCPENVCTDRPPVHSVANVLGA